MANIGSLSWNATALQYLKGKYAWCLHQMATSHQSDGHRAKMNAGTEMCPMIGLINKSLNRIGCGKRERSSSFPVEIQCSQRELVHVDLMQDLIPGMKDGTVRTAIDTGCGVASWGGDLLEREILTVSLAPRDNHEAQVQFALEHGIPAILGILSTQRLPFPSNSFDMEHCSKSLIPWTEFGGIYLIEIHRILRLGGFWVLSGSPVNYEHRWRGWNTTIEDQKNDYDDLRKLLTSMCFKLYDRKDDISVWQKALDNTCYDELALDAYPPKCNDGTEPYAAWYIPLRSCLVTPSQKLKKLGLESTPKWPERLHVTPERIFMLPEGNANAFKHDDSKRKVRVKHCKTLVPALGTDKIQNVMDMNTLYGGFAAALIDDPLWVMNVVSSYGSNSLGVVYDRGLIGTIHDWCEAFFSVV